MRILDREIDVLLVILDTILITVGKRFTITIYIFKLLKI